MISLIHTLLFSYFIGASFVTIAGLLMNPIEESNYYFGLFLLAAIWPVVFVRIFSTS